MVKLLISTVMALMFFCSCTPPQTDITVEESRIPTYGLEETQETQTEQETQETAQDAVFYAVSSVEAEKMMNEGAMILDVRTEEERIDGYIEGSILIPHDQISQYIELLPDDKDKTILVYCRTGRRSEIAAQELANLGYTQVYDFGGIITDWHGDIVKD